MPAIDVAEERRMDVVTEQLLHSLIERAHSRWRHRQQLVLFGASLIAWRDVTPLIGRVALPEWR
jgi:hypothetical protein